MLFLCVYFAIAFYSSMVGCKCCLHDGVARRPVSEFVRDSSFILISLGVKNGGHSSFDKAIPVIN